MSAPWENTRPELNMHLANNSIREIHAIAYGLLADADALLAVARELGDGGDLETVADLLQEATNDHGVDQSFDGNHYFLSDLLRKMSQALDALPEHLRGG